MSSDYVNRPFAVHPREVLQYESVWNGRDPLTPPDPMAVTIRSQLTEAGARRAKKRALRAGRRVDPAPEPRPVSRPSLDRVVEVLSSASEELTLRQIVARAGRYSSGHINKRLAELERDGLVSKRSQPHHVWGGPHRLYRWVGHE